MDRKGAIGGVPGPSVNVDYTLKGRNFEIKLFTKGHLNDLERERRASHLKTKGEQFTRGKCSCLLLPKAEY